MNLKSLILDTSVTYLVRSDLIVGGNLIFDPNNSSFEKYDLGFSWSAGTNQLVGLKHESLNRHQIELGKLFLYIHHYTTLN